MFEFLSAKLRCVGHSAKWFSTSSGDFFDEIHKREEQKVSGSWKTIQKRLLVSQLAALGIITNNNQYVSRHDILVLL